MIVIPKHLYAGLKNQDGEESRFPLAFVTPYEPDTKAFEKRLETINSWVQGYSWQNKSGAKQPEPMTLANAPRDGFKIADSIRRTGWNGGNVVWRMVHPSGFEFEISSANLARILDCTTIKNGEIEGACVFGRDGAQNVLLPITSEPWLEAQKNTQRAAKKVSTRDAKPGDIILLKDGSKVQYGGYHTVASVSQKYEDAAPSGYGYNYRRNRISATSLTVQKKRHLVIESLSDDFVHSYYAKAEGLKDGDDVITGYSDLHISEIVSTGNRFNSTLVDRTIYCNPDNGYTVVPKGSTLLARKTNFFSYDTFISQLIWDINSPGLRFRTFFVGIGNSEYVLSSRYSYSNTNTKPSTEDDLYETSKKAFSPNEFKYHVIPVARDLDDAGNYAVSDSWSDIVLTRAVLQAARFRHLEYVLDGNVLSTR